MTKTTGGQNPAKQSSVTHPVAANVSHNMSRNAKIGLIAGGSILVLAALAALLYFLLRPKHKSSGGTPSGNSPGGNSPGGKSPGNKHPGGQSPGNKHPGSQSPGNKHPGGQSPGNKHPGGQSPGNKHPGGKSPGTDHPGGKSPGTDHPGGKSPGEQYHEDCPEGCIPNKDGTGCQSVSGNGPCVSSCKLDTSFKVVPAHNSSAAEGTVWKNNLPAQSPKRTSDFVERNISWMDPSDTIQYMSYDPDEAMLLASVGGEYGCGGGGPVCPPGLSYKDDKGSYPSWDQNWKESYTGVCYDTTWHGSGSGSGKMRGVEPLTMPSDKYPNEMPYPKDYSAWPHGFETGYATIDNTEVRIYPTKQLNSYRVIKVPNISKWLKDAKKNNVLAWNPITDVYDKTVWTKKQEDLPNVYGIYKPSVLTNLIDQGYLPVPKLISTNYAYIGQMPPAINPYVQKAMFQSLYNNWVTPNGIDYCSYYWQAPISWLVPTKKEGPGTRNVNGKTVMLNKLYKIQKGNSNWLMLPDETSKDRMPLCSGDFCGLVDGSQWNPDDGPYVPLKDEWGYNGNAFQWFHDSITHILGDDTSMCLNIFIGDPYWCDFEEVIGGHLSANLAKQYSWQKIGRLLAGLNSHAKKANHLIQFIINDKEECQCPTDGTPLLEWAMKWMRSGYKQVFDARNASSPYQGYWNPDSKLKGDLLTDVPNFQLLLSGTYTQNFPNKRGPQMDMGGTPEVSPNNINTPDPELNQRGSGLGELYWNINQMIPCSGSHSQTHYYAPVCKGMSIHSTFRNMPVEMLEMLMRIGSTEIFDGKSAAGDWKDYRKQCTNASWHHKYNSEGTLAMQSIEMLPIIGAKDSVAKPIPQNEEPHDYQLMCPQFAWGGTNKEGETALTTVNQPCGTGDLFGIWSWEPFLSFLSVYSFVFGADTAVIYDQMFLPQHWAKSDGTKMCVAESGSTSCKTFSPNGSDSAWTDQWSNVIKEAGTKAQYTTEQNPSALSTITKQWPTFCKHDAKDHCYGAGPYPDPDARIAGTQCAPICHNFDKPCTFANASVAKPNVPSSCDCSMALLKNCKVDPKIMGKTDRSAPECVNKPLLQKTPKGIIGDWCGKTEDAKKRSVQDYLMQHQVLYGQVCGLPCIPDPPTAHGDAASEGSNGKAVCQAFADLYGCQHKEYSDMHLDSPYCEPKSDPGLVGMCKFPQSKGGGSGADICKYCEKWSCLGQDKCDCAGIAGTLLVNNGPTAKCITSTASDTIKEWVTDNRTSWPTPCQNLEAKGGWCKNGGYQTKFTGGASGAGGGGGGAPKTGADCTAKNCKVCDGTTGKYCQVCKDGFKTDKAGKDCVKS